MYATALEKTIADTRVPQRHLYALSIAPFSKTSRSSVKIISAIVDEQSAEFICFYSDIILYKHGAYV